MAEGDTTNNDAGDDRVMEEGGAGHTLSEAEATGADSAGFEPSGVGDPATEDGGDGKAPRPGDWNPGEQSGGGGELY